MTWDSMPLGEFVTLKRGYDLPASLRVDGPVPVVSSSGVTGYHDAAKVKGPGVVTGRYGTLGEVFFIDEDFTGSNRAAVPSVNRNDLHALTVRATRDLLTPSQRLANCSCHA